MSCEKCAYLGNEDDGNYPELVQDRWDVCTRQGYEHYSNLKSFPFKKKMLCFYLNFWRGEFAEKINGEEENDNKQFLKHYRKYGAGS